MDEQTLKVPELNHRLCRFLLCTDSQLHFNLDRTFFFPFYWAEKETYCISFYWQHIVSRCFKCRTFGSFYFIWRRRDIKLRILLGGTWSCKEFEGLLPKPKETALAVLFSTTSATCFISQTGSLLSSSQANWRVNSLRIAVVWNTIPSLTKVLDIWWRDWSWTFFSADILTRQTQA